jgi:hypothetical protein
MTRYRPRAVLLLLLLLHLTACQTWHSVSTASPSQFIEAEQPDRVRVRGGGVLDLELVSPSVEGDQLVGAGGFSMPLEDVLRLETRGFSLDRTVLAVLGGVVLLPVAIFVGYVIACPDGIVGEGGNGYESGEAC